MNYSFPLSLSRSVSDLRNGTLDLEDYLNGICDRVEKTDPVISSFLPEPGRRERLIKEAKILKQQYPDPSDRPVLYGIPIGVKDIFRTDGFLTQAGSLLPPELFSGIESSVVTALRNAGAVIFGKTITTEFAYFEPGPTCNPHNQLHTPGGSSSGSAAAVACGFTPLALGTQTIGSIARPASYCGIYGFKPSFGRIPTDGIIPFSESADHVGFFTQDLEGIELVAEILCEQWKPISKQPDRLPVIGVPSGKYLNQADQEITGLFRGKIYELKQTGCLIKEMDLFGEIDTINDTHKRMIAADFFNVHKNWFKEFEHLYRPATRELILEGKKINSETLDSLRKQRFSIRKRTEEFRIKNKIDLWVSPSSCTPPPVGLNSTGSPLMSLPWTFMGLPAVTVPSGTTSEGLPFGLQFSGAFMEDEILLTWLKKIRMSGN